MNLIQSVLYPNKYSNEGWILLSSYQKSREPHPLVMGVPLLLITVIILLAPKKGDQLYFNLFILLPVLAYCISIYQGRSSFSLYVKGDQLLFVDMFKDERFIGIERVSHFDCSSSRKWWIYYQDEDNILVKKSFPPNLNWFEKLSIIPNSIKDIEVLKTDNSLEIILHKTTGSSIVGSNK